MQDKAYLRSQIKAQRFALNSRAQRRREQQLSLQLLRIKELTNAQTIAAYCPANGEISPMTALSRWQRQGKRIYLPQMLAQRQMLFKPFTSNTPLVKNTVKIEEPQGRKFITPRNIDVVLLPLVAFDAQGNRLGMGGGYYDRAFAFLQQQTWRKKPLLIGLAHDFQQVEHIPKQAWDVPLSMIVTNQRCFRLYRNN
jgi:5-formyltetrahydrofolate cyclo-ligase